MSVWSRSVEFTSVDRATRLGLVFLAGLAYAQVALAAGGGVVEINQAAALAGGVTASDAPGFPVTIDVPGSYVLTGDLVLPDANTTGLQVVADDVRIDLAGFSIRGVVSCTLGAESTDCAPVGAGVGIDGQGELTRVRDGVVRGMGDDGIRVAASARVEGVALTDNGGDGLETGLFARVRDVLAQRNGDDGIDLGSSSRILESQAFTNDRFGIRAGTNVVVDRVQAASNQGGGILGTDLTVTASTVSGNPGMGIVWGSAAILRGNLLVGNTSNGISSFGSSGGLPGNPAILEGNVIRGSGFAGIQGVTDGVVVGNVVTDNGTTAISCAALTEDADGCIVSHNVANRNGGGLGAFPATGYLHNVFSGNGGGDVFGSPQELGPNLCGESTTCP